MKKFYILLIALFVVNGAMGQWVPQNSGTGNNLSSVYFTDANTGYAVGDNGTILKTTDGGTNWGTQNSGTSAWLTLVYFPKEDTGYVVGAGGTVLKTTDGGTNWTIQNSGTSYNYSSVYFTDPNTGYAVGAKVNPFFEDMGIILKTTDGGNHWTTNLTITGALGSVCFPGKETGFVVGSNVKISGPGIILKTIDGGVTWTDSVFESLNRIFSLFFTDKDTGYAVSSERMTGDGIVLKTINGGVNWTVQNLNNWVFNSVCFPNVDIGYGVGFSSLGGAGIILKTTDGGVNWDVQDSTLSNSLYSVYFTNANIGYTVGDSGTILKTINGGGYPVGSNDITSESKLLKIYPNPSSTHVTIETFSIPTKSRLSIMNPNGQELITRQITEPKTQIDISNLPSGLYFVRVTGERTVEVGKFVKQ
jgi:photosystem II stability/assembly factor-like uncharacterized protein